MKKNNTDPLVTLNFGRMCMANFLLYASVYLILPLMPAVAQQTLQIPVDQSSWLYLAFVAGMVAAAPFYAYLGDAYKRKNVLMSAVLTLIVALAGMEFVQVLATVGLGSAAGRRLWMGRNGRIDPGHRCDGL